MGRVVAIVVFVVCAIFYVLGLLVFRSDAGADEATLSKGTIAKDHWNMNVRVASIDPTKEAATLAITPEPQGGLTDDDGYSAKEDYSFDIVTDDGTKTIKIKAGDPMVTTQVPISISGEVSSYPNDVYSGDIEIDSGTEVPLEIDAESHIQAYTADMSLDEHSKPTEMTVNFDFSRSRSIVIFAWFIYVLLACVALLALSVAIAVARGAKFEFSMVGWIGALLFVLPAIRNSLPGQPPIGTIGDFAVFFWAEITIVISLVVLLSTWHQRSKAPA
ncbi:MAG: DUF4436 family protein [Candidatus Eremiobacteraeota bacterium]|nr:DUF4436 family protein [Candidatus Eremiobacteraeota bacterium]